MPQTPSYYTVLSGDLVESRKLSSDDYDNALYSLEQGLRAICERFDGDFSIYRGDAFQCILSQSPTPLLASIMLRLFLRARALDARISEAWGPIDNYRKDIKTATGPALLLSGTGLDNIKNMRLRLSLHQIDMSPSFVLNIRFIDNLISHTSAKQAQALYLYHWLRNNDHATIAKELETSRENATKLLNAGNYHLVDEFIAVAAKEHAYG